jgi:hypothetical protein
MSRSHASTAERRDTLNLSAKKKYFILSIHLMLCRKAATYAALIITNHFTATLECLASIVIAQDIYAMIVPEIDHQAIVKDVI